MKYDADIFDAVEFGDLETIIDFWTEDTDIDYQEDNGVNLIMLATKYKHKHIVKHLLTLNPNLYLWNNEDETVFQIAERLKDKTIYKMLVDYCWKDNEKMFLFEYHVKPKFETEILGAHTNCWIMNEDFNAAKIKSQELIESENWEIDSFEDVDEIKKGEIDEAHEKFSYYEQVIIDKEVIVFYTYDRLE